MVSADRPNFLNAFGALCLLFDKKPTGALIAIYFKSLEKHPIEQVEKAISQAIASCKFFPKPAELLEFLTPQDTALAAWVLVETAIGSIGNYASVRFADPVIHSVIQSLGGWHKICLTSNADMPWLKKDFEARYKLAAMQTEHPSYLPGSQEIAWRSEGMTELIKQPRQIGYTNHEQKRLG